MTDATKPPDGYRLLRDGEVKQEGDLTTLTSLGTLWWPTVSAGETIDEADRRAGLQFARRIDQPAAQPTEKQECRTCVYALNTTTDDSDDHRCHRYPPDNHDGWPIVQPQEWCGEWRA